MMNITLIYTHIGFIVKEKISLASSVYINNNKQNITQKTLQNFELLCIWYLYYFSHNISYKTRGSHIVRKILKKKKRSNA